MARDSSTVVARVGLDDRGFQEGINKIQRSLKVVQSDFAAASSKLGDFGKSTEGLKLKAESLNKQMELQKSKVEALTKSYQESVEKKGEDAKATENLKIKLNYAIVEMNKMGNELSVINQQIDVQSSGFTKLSENFVDIGSKMETVSEGFTNVGSELSKAVTTPIVAAGAGLFKLASDFDEASDSIRIGTGATGESLKGLEADFKAVYSSVNTNMGDASKVISDLNTRTGLTGKSLQNLSMQMINLANVTGEDINTLIPAATRMFQDAGLKTEDYAKALDYTFKVSQNTGIGVSRLQELMAQFGGPLRQMGFDWQTTAAMLGKFEKEGVNTELVVGSLRIALGKMAKEGISEPNKALQEMITKIKAAGTAGQANALALEMFGAKAGPDMAAAIREGRLNLDELIKSLQGSPETINGVAKDTADAAEQFIILKNRISVSLEPLGQKLFQAVNNAMPSIEKLINAIINIIEKFNALSPTQQDMIIKFALIAAAIGPVGIVIAAVTALIAIGVLLYKNWDTVKEVTERVWNSIKDFFSGLWNWIKDTVSSAWNSIKSITSSTWNDIKSFIETPINSAKNAVSNAIDSIKGFFSNLKLPEIKIPKIKLPHFNIKGEFSLTPPSVPHLDVSWYAKGGIFNKPSVIGVGEAGTEAVLPIDRLDELMARAIEKVKGNNNGGGLSLHIENFYNNTDKDVEQLAYELGFYSQRLSLAKGGA